MCASYNESNQGSAALQDFATLFLSLNAILVHVWQYLVAILHACKRSIFNSLYIPTQHTTQWAHITEWVWSPIQKNILWLTYIHTYRHSISPNTESDQLAFWDVNMNVLRKFLSSAFYRPTCFPPTSNMCLHLSVFRSITFGALLFGDFRTQNVIASQLGATI